MSGETKNVSAGQALSPARRTGPARDDPPHALDAPVELVQGDALVGSVDAAQVVSGQGEGGHAVGRDAPLAEEARVGEAGDEGGDDGRVGRERGLEGGV